ncbi:unnamed protein product [Jaminaea pallidilutea]
MIVRVRSKDGNFRFALEPTDDVAVLVQKVLETAPNADQATLTFSNEPRGGEQDAHGLKGNTLADLGIAHGHLLYAAYKEAAAEPADKPESSGSTAPQALNGSTAAVPSTSTTTEVKAPSSKQPSSSLRPWESAKEDAVDVYWEKRDGMIPRPKDANFCRHGEKAMCDYCMPLEPYDAKYHTEHNIKHASFHAYLKKLDVATNASKPAQTYIPPLEEPNYTVRVPCPSGQHPSWPAGICTKCQPSAITLQSQEFRMVDHVEFSHPQLIENLLAFWRTTGVQRYGLLLGHYEPYEVVPMGIKAVVEAIHEPPQEGETDGLTLGLPWDDQKGVERLAGMCNLQVVGQIYTDLSPADPTFSDPEKAGQVLCKRHKDSFFISSLETAFAGHLQAEKPNPCRFSLTGKYGSKFVTCVLSGTEEGAIDVSAYQISEQGVGMVKSDMIEASVSPNTVRVKPSEGERYVPEVFHRYKNEYGIYVKESAKPTFPVEYLLVTLTHGFPNVPMPRFLSTTPFAIENRPGLHDQDMNKALASIASAIGRDDFDIASASKTDEESKLAKQKLIGVLSDWHLIAFLNQSELLDAEDMEALCQVSVSHDLGPSLDRLLERPGWRNLAALARANEVGTSSGNSNDEVLGDYAADDYIPPEAMAGASGGGGGGASASANGSRSSGNQKTAAESSPQPPQQPHRAAAASSTAAPPSSNRRDEFEYTGDDEDDEMAFEDVEDDDGNVGYDEDDAFDDASSTLSADMHRTRVSEEARPGRPSSPGANRAATSTRSAPDPAPASRPAPPPQEQAEPAMMACPHCTFENAPGATDCDVCGLPLSG